MSDSKPNDAPWPGTRIFLLFLAATLFTAFPLVALGFNTFFYRDFAAYCYPLTYFTGQSLRHGELPLWDPYTLCGVPLMAQLGQWYPPTLLSLFLPMPWSINFFNLLHLFWGGFGMYWLARRWNAGTFGAAFAGMAYVFNGVTMSSLIWITYIAALAWLPWVVGCVQAAWQNGGRWLVLAAVAGALQVLAGMPEITVFTWLFIAALWIYSLFTREVQLVSSARRSLGILLLAAGITMVQMLPFFDLLAHSQRNQHAATGEWSMPAWGWANLIVPLFHCHPSPQGVWFQDGQYLLTSYYPGAGVLALAVVGALLAKKHFKAAIVTMTLLGWMMALGTNGAVYHGLRHVFPFIGFSRFPIKFVVLPAFLVPLLAARGIDCLRNDDSPRTRRCLVTVTIGFVFAMEAVLWFGHQFPRPLDQWDVTVRNTLVRAVLMLGVVTAIFFSVRSKTPRAGFIFQLIALALLPLDALTHSPKIVPTLPASSLAPGIWQASGKPLPPALGEGRIMIHPDAENRLLYSPVADLGKDLTGKRVAEWYNFNLLDRIPKVTGPVPLQPDYFSILENRLYYTTGGHSGFGLVNFLAVEWLSAPDNPTRWQSLPGHPPIITAGQKPVFATDERALSGIIANDFDPRRTVYLPASGTTSVPITNETACVVTNVHFGLNTVDADANAAEPSIVVIAQNYYHLWRATVDDKPAPLLRANLAFQAVAVPAGMHHLRLVYTDPYFRIGAILSLLSLIGCGVIWRRCPSPRNR
jgi:Bacterial membrane protein YfhO